MNTAIFLLLAGPSLSAAPIGHFLILENEQLVEGTITREGNLYVIRREVGETFIPAERVLAVAADRPGAYLAMRERCNLRDLDDRLRLVRWCIHNNFREEAMAELEILQRHQPQNDQIRAMLYGLREIKTTAPVVPLKVTPSPLPVVEVEPVALNREAFGMFVSKVQPILMNLCVRCHATNESGSFHLNRVIGGGDRQSALLNLSAVMKQLKRDDRASSPFLLQAVTAHGKMPQPAIRDRQAPAYLNLEAWVMTALPEEEPKPVEPKGFEEPKLKEKSVTIFGETSTSQAKPEPQTAPKDPFDPAIFNGTIEPKK